MENANIFWHNNIAGENARADALNQKGLVLWLTGPSGSGKSTIAMETESELIRLGFAAYVLDGDNLRHGINSNLGFSKEDRDENIRRVAETARLFYGAQIITIVSVISPFEKARTAARAVIGAESFCEVYVKASADTRRSRDPKGLYAKESRGEISLIGPDMEYEAPQAPEITIDTDALSVGCAVKILVQYVFERQPEYLLPKILETAIYAAYDAGKLILGVYGRDFAVEYKDDSSPLTEADKKSNDLICNRLAKYAPYIDILAEESADDKRRLENNFCFIVDPLDGTKEFVKKNGEFTVNIGLAYKNRAVLGVVYAPCLGKLYYAAAKLGAYAIDLNKDMFKLLDENTKIKVSGKATGLIVVKSRSHSDEKTEALLEKNKHKIQSQTDIGSALKGCLIAEGAADVYYRFGYTMEWDTCAMQCVVEEAGGIFTQGDMSEMTYNRENSLNEKGFIILNREESRLE